MLLECKECKKLKVRESFYKHPEGKYGVLSRCKDCIKAGRKTEKELEMSRKRDSDRYYNNPKRREYIFKTSIERRKKMGYGLIHGRTNRAIKKLGIRPDFCPICLKKHNRVIAHHFDYNHWNKFIFACSICHSKLHSNDIKTEDCEIIILPKINTHE